MPPEIIGNKFCHLDIHMAVDGQQINLEVQVEDEGDYPERALYYWARIYSNALPAGGKYSELPRTIIISILDFSLFSGSTEFHSEYRTLEITHYTPLTDKQVLHFFELPKLPGSIDRNDLKLLWLALFKANTEEELEQIAALEVPEMVQAINTYHSVTASEEYKELERMRDKALHDEASAIYNAERKAEQKERAIWQSVVAEKDAELISKDAEIADKDTEIASKDAEIADKDTEIASKDAEIADKDTEIASKDTEIADKDAKLAEIMAENERLRLQLENPK